MRLSERHHRPLLVNLWPEGFPKCWHYMEPRRHRPCGEVICYDTFLGEWFHPAYHEESGFAARSSGFGAKCPGRGCGREIYLTDTEPVVGEDRPRLFD